MVYNLAATVILQNERSVQMYSQTDEGSEDIYAGVHAILIDGLCVISVRVYLLVIMMLNCSPECFWANSDN